MRRTSFAAILLSVMTMLASVPAFAATAQQPPEDTTARIKKLCNRFSGQDNVRCLAREVQKWQQSLDLILPTQDYEFRDAQDFGQSHLRALLRAERRKDQRDTVSTRRTYRQMQPVDDVNTQRVSYLNYLRLGRRDCMLKDPGRPRSICMDQLGNWARKQMHKASGSMKFPAE